MQDQSADILQQIVSRRRGRLQAEGADQGIALPSTRVRNRVPLLAGGPVIAEIKRRSPSAGSIADLPDPVAQAARYHAAGIRAFSVLTEQDHFGGDLSDLLAVRAAFPDCAILRKDFLLTTEDIRVSADAGADAVLLIAAILTDAELMALHVEAERRGLQALVEVHTRAELQRVAALHPALLGINARDLRDFSVDLLRPVALRAGVTWRADVVFESGIRSDAGAELAGASGFTGILVGEAAVRDPGLPARLAPAHTRGTSGSASGFWGRITELLQRRLPGLPAPHSGQPGARPEGFPRRPLVKICGLARVEDARMAVELGADLLGFVFAESPRKVDASVLHTLGDIGVPRVAVVDGQQDIPAEVARLAADGLIDAVQLHGGLAATPPMDAAGRLIPWYPAIRVAGAADLQSAVGNGSARVLLDAYSERAAGGTGERISPEVLAQRPAGTPLWLAGGLSPDNIAQAIRGFHPELVDASSGLEAEPGRKDPESLERYFTEINRASN